MNIDWLFLFRDTLKEYTLLKIESLNSINDFMRTVEFYNLPRPVKAELYEKCHELLTEVEELGIRCEKHNIKLK